MRVKDIWDVVPFQGNIRDLSARVTSNRWTKTFCLLAALHCILQVGLQFGAYGNNRATASGFEAIVSNMTLTSRPFAILENNGDLTLCTDIPQRFGGPDICVRRAFNGGSSKRAASIVPRFTASLESNGDIELAGLDTEEPDETDIVGSQCIETFPWVFDVIHDATREDLVFVLFQGWLFGISLAAVFHESIPHLATALASEMLATTWSAYKVARTKSFKMDFTRILTNGYCNGVNVLPHYFAYREAIEATIMALNILALLGFVFLSWRLYRDYASRMLKRVDSRPDMECLYRVMLSLSTVIHLAAFFLITVSGLFIDQLFIGRIRLVARHVVTYEVIFLLLIACVVPWVVVGTVSIRKESRRGLIVFFILSLGFLAVWGTMFASQIYRFMFGTWSFFATMSIFACLLLVTVVCLSVYAFLNFGLGLPEYLQRPMVHPADNVTWMIEGGMDTVKSKGSLQMSDDLEESVIPISNEQRRISLISSGSRHSLATSPGQPFGISGSPPQSLQSRIALPISANLTIPTPVVTQNNSLPENPRRPPGLKAPPRKAVPTAPTVSRLLVPPSRWSATTVNSDPSTPVPVSATGVRNQSRWSSSTTATVTTSTSGGSRLSVVPPVPALPVSRLPSSQEIIDQAESNRRNVI